MTAELAIHLITCNEAPALRRCVEALLANTAGEFVLRIWDNGSRAATLALLRSYAERRNVSVHFAGGHFGQILSHNALMQAVTEPFVALLNVDVAVGKDWNAPYLAALRGEPSLGAAGPTLRQDIGMPYLEASLLVLPADVARQFGPFDCQAYAQGCCEDSDLSARLIKAGFRLASLPLRGTLPGHRRIDMAPGHDARGQEVANHRAFRSRWEGKTREPGLVIRREGSSGDVICATPMLRELYRQDPARPLIFETYYPYPLLHNPHVAEIRLPRKQDEPDIMLDLRHGLERDILRDREIIQTNEPPHLVDAMSFGSGVTLSDRRPEIFLTELERRWPAQHLPQRYFVFATDTDWATRNWPHWNALCRLAWRRFGLPMVILGAHRHGDVSGDGVIDLRHKTGLRQAFAIVAGAAGFVSSDTGLAHAAGAFRVPSVVFFGIVQGRYRLHEGQIGIDTPLLCRNCQVRDLNMSTVSAHFCMRAGRTLEPGRDFADCMTGIDAARALGNMETFYGKEGA